MGMTASAPSGTTPPAAYGVVCAGSVVAGGGGAAVVVGGTTVGGGAVVDGCVRVGDVVPLLGDVVVAPVSVDVVAVPYAPLYSYWPRHDVHTGCVVAAGNGTSGRLPIAVPM